jgi:hypothetical protein
MPRRAVTLRAGVLVLAALIGAALTPRPAAALPLYARQTGQPCATCHTAFLELTPFGRRFKLGGYTLDGGDWKGPPFAVMLQPTFTNTQGAQPGGAAPGFGVNNNLVMQQISLFTGGRISDNLGAFVQGTYDGVSHRFGWDNTDVRYARSVTVGGHTLLWGITANNNPTVQDVWNTIPAWSFPFISSQLAPLPTATPFINQVYAQQVAGLSAYLFIDDIFYFEAGGYRPLSTNTELALGIGTSGQNPISGTAPYWRVAAEKNIGDHSWEVGTFGLASRVSPLGLTQAGTDSFADIGVDTQYQYLGDPHAVTFRGAWIHENHNTSASQLLGLADNSNDQPALPERFGLIHLRPHLEPDHRAGLGRRHHGRDALRHRDWKPEQRRVDLRARLSAVQPRRPVVLAMAQFPHRPAIYALDQVRRSHDELRRDGKKRERQQYVLCLRLDHVLVS